MDEKVNDHGLSTSCGMSPTDGLRPSVDISASPGTNKKTETERFFQRDKYW
jgi:hypothetical protein